MSLRVEVTLSICQEGCDHAIVEASYSETMSQKPLDPSTEEMTAEDHLAAAEDLALAHTRLEEMVSEAKARVHTEVHKRSQSMLDTAEKVRTSG